MKKLLMICLVMLACFDIKAQGRITGTMDLPAHQVRNFNKINFEISYQVVEDRGTIRVSLSNPKITVHPDATYRYNGKLYTRQDLGLADWPQNQSPVNFGVYLRVNYPGGTVNHMFSCTESGTCQDNNDYILRSVENTNNYKPAVFTVSYNGTMTYTGQGDDQVEALIAAKAKNTASTAANKTEDEGASNPLKNTSSLPAGKSDQSLSASSEVLDRSTKQEIDRQVITGVAAVTGGLLDDWNSAIEAKERRRDAERKADQNEKAKKYEAKFKAKYLPLMNQAIAGDENARMILYFTSDRESLWDYVPERWKWLDEAANNNNTDALLEKAENVFSKMMYQKEFKGHDHIYYIEKAANLGNTEAMLFTAYYGHFLLPNKSPDTKKALELYTAAADKGNPIAMYTLGMIYKYGYGDKINKYNKSLYAKFDVTLNEKTAFEWFLKSYETFSNGGYHESTFAKSKSFGKSKIFQGYIDEGNGQFRACLLELSKIFKKGEVVLQDKKKAKEFEELSTFYNPPVLKEKFDNTDNY